MDSRGIPYWSLDVLDDVLEGGYGIHDLSEEITIKWSRFMKSKEKLGLRKIEKILEVFQSHRNINLILE